MQYRDKKGRFASFPISFTEKVIKPNAKRHGLTTKEYIKANKVDLKKLLKANKSDHKTNKIGLESLIKKLDNKTNLFIYNGNKKYSCTKVQALEYLSKVNQALMSLNPKTFFITYTYVQLNGFETVIFCFPDLRILDKKKSQSKS